MPGKIALRHRATVAATELTGNERVLEIGPGHGVATRLLLDAAPCGRVVAVDRSATMIAALRVACAEAVRDGRLVVRAAPLEEVDFGAERFDRIVAIDVDLDRRLGDRWPPLLTGLLAEGGRVVFGFDDAPGGGAAGFVASAAARLERLGFEVVVDGHEEAGRTVATLVARRGRKGSAVSCRMAEGPRTPLEAVGAWQEAANAGNAAELLALSHEEILVIGPRGEGRGHELLRAWLERAGLELRTLRPFVRGGTVVLEQHGVWRSKETGEPVGEQGVASHFEVEAGRVVSVARYDELTEALAKAGLGSEDEVAP